VAAPFEQRTDGVPQRTIVVDDEDAGIGGQTHGFLGG
jgi:hypothetical protein